MKRVSYRILLLLFCALLRSSAAGQAPSPHDGGKSPGETPRESQFKIRPQNPCPPENPCEGVLFPSKLSPGRLEENDQEFRGEIQEIFAREAFADLDAVADHVRASKDRLGGGEWKLFELYQLVATPPGGSRGTESGFASRAVELQKWVAARPQSITARVALAELYRLYGWKVRGPSYADAVPPADWREYRDRVAQAYKTLAEADKLPAKCPHWYLVMLEIARDQGWSKDKMRELFERAIAFEPAYYHYYRVYAFNLLPKWYGKPGEAEAFAEESLRRIGGREGAFVYSEIATLIYCFCSDTLTPPSLSWPKIQEGFAEMEQRYGATILKLNRFASLAYQYHDREVAQSTLARIGDRWDISVWQDQATLDLARSWAGLTNP